MEASNTSRKRLFFALWPDETTRQKCVGIIQKIDNKTVRLVASANLHVTLVFLGNVLEEQEHALKEKAATIAVPQLEISFNQLSYWKKPGILCLTTTEIGAEITRLVNDLTLIAGKLDIAVDKRPYKPHVTLARKVTESMSLEFEPICWPASSFCLVESCPQAGKSDYSIIGEWVCQETKLPAE